MLEKPSIATLQSTLSATAWPKKKKMACLRKLPQHFMKMLHLLPHRLSLFSDLLHCEVHCPHLSSGEIYPLGHSEHPGLACSPVLQSLASSLSVNNTCIHSSYSLSMKSLASAPEVTARYIQIQGSRRTGCWERSDTAVSSWANGIFSCGDGHH